MHSILRRIYPLLGFLVGVTIARVIKAYYGQNFPVISDLAHALLPSIGILIGYYFYKRDNRK
ncbi:MAG: hypothetical protein KA059_02805 [Elusimicrobiales bacterium]|nr:hypothetical protein [Elusimicrobiales bacterium]NLH38881.1 hypothetical protein [Elusimicrobiota bacterium]